MTSRELKFAIIASKQDEAGKNIASFISNKDIPVVYAEERIIFTENIDEKNEYLEKADFIIFASKHKGKTPKILTIHAPGNWKKAELGGKDLTVCPTNSLVLKTFLQELNKNIPEGWQATMEVTHHGPLIKKPCLFIEVGSNEKDWENKEAGRAIAKTIENAINRINKEKENFGNKFISAIAIGGPHYCQSLNKIQLNSEYAIGHIIPDYAFPISKETIKEAISKTIPHPNTVIIDWKGINKSEDRQETIKLLNELNIKNIRTSVIKK